MFQDVKAGLYDDDDYPGQNGGYQYNNNYGNEYDDYGDYGDYGEETGEVGGSGGQNGQGKGAFGGAGAAKNEVDDPALAAAIAASLAD